MYCLEVITSKTFQAQKPLNLERDPCSAVFPRDSRARLRPGARAIVRCASARSSGCYTPEATRRLWYFRRHRAAFNAFIEALYYTDDLTLATCAALTAKHKRAGWTVARESLQWGGGDLSAKRTVRGGLIESVSAGSVAELDEKLKAWKGGPSA
jgi:hypothetical protein